MKRRPEPVDALPPELATFDPVWWAPTEDDVAYGTTFAEVVAGCTREQVAMWRELFAWDRWCEARHAWDRQHGADHGEATLRWLQEKARGHRLIGDRHHAMWAGS